VSGLVFRFGVPVRVEPLAAMAAPETISTIVFSADGRHLAAIDKGQTIWVGVGF
jgi:hypothetical protein